MEVIACAVIAWFAYMFVVAVCRELASDPKDDPTAHVGEVDSDGF